jgi:predicted O-methyltransferase YrrM
MTDLLIDLPNWLRSQCPSANALDDERPWITFPAIRFLERVIRPHMRVFEYGSGGSTLFFARRVREVISIEHDPVWALRVGENLQKKALNHCQIRCVVAELSLATTRQDPADPHAYRSHDLASEDKQFIQYASSIDSHPDHSLDIILIDGRARPSCFLHSIPKVRCGGYIVWDNTEREYYWPGMRLAPVYFQLLDFPGPTPYAQLFTRTSVWRSLRR